LPVVSLGKAGDSFFFQDQKYLIIERTAQFMFVQVWDLVRNEDGSIPLIPLNKRELGKTYYDVRAISTYRESVLDGFDKPTGFLTASMEHIRPNYDVEITPINSRGVLIYDQLGFNADRAAVEAKYNEVTEKFATEQAAKLRREKEAKEREKAGLNWAQKVAAAKTLRQQARDDLRAAMDGKNVDGAMDSSEIAEAVNRYNFYDTILKTL
jgi:hypothetical protein